MPKYTYTEGGETFTATPPTKEAVEETPEGGFISPYEQIPPSMGYVSILPEEIPTPPVAEETAVAQPEPAPEVTPAPEVPVFTEDIMSPEEYQARMKNIELQYKTPPARPVLPPIPMAVQLLMLSVDALTGKPRWLEFLLNDRPLAQQKLDLQYEKAMQQWTKNESLRKAQAEIAKLALARQYAAGRRRLAERERGLERSRVDILNNIAQLQINIKDAQNRMVTLYDEGDKQVLQERINAWNERLKFLQEEYKRVSGEAIETYWQRVEGSEFKLTPISGISEAELEELARLQGISVEEVKRKWSPPATR